MGIDGMSMGQINPSKDLPSSHHAINANALANMSKDDVAIDFDQFTRNQQVGRKEDNYGEDVENTIYAGGDTEASADSNENQNEEFDEENDDATYIKRYVLRLSNEEGIIELYDNELDVVIDTIDAENLLNIASKLKYAEGLILEKKM